MARAPQFVSMQPDWYPPPALYPTFVPSHPIYPPVPVREYPPPPYAHPLFPDCSADNNQMQGGQYWGQKASIPQENETMEVYEPPVPSGVALIWVPLFAVGELFGRNGENIKRLEEETGTSIRREARAKHKNLMFSIVGGRSEIACAINAVEDLIQKCTLNERNKCSGIADTRPGNNGKEKKADGQEVEQSTKKNAGVWRQTNECGGCNKEQSLETSSVTEEDDREYMDQLKQEDNSTSSHAVASYPVCANNGMDTTTSSSIKPMKENDATIKIGAVTSKSLPEQPNKEFHEIAVQKGTLNTSESGMGKSQPNKIEQDILNIVGESSKEKGDIRDPHVASTKCMGDKKTGGKEEFVEVDIRKDLSKKSTTDAKEVSKALVVGAPYESGSWWESGELSVNWSNNIEETVAITRFAAGVFTSRNRHLLKCITKVSGARITVTFPKMEDGMEDVCNHIVHISGAYVCVQQCRRVIVSLSSIIHEGRLRTTRGGEKPISVNVELANIKNEHKDGGNVEVNAREVVGDLVLMSPGLAAQLVGSGGVVVKSMERDACATICVRSSRPIYAHDKKMVFIVGTRAVIAMVKNLLVQRFGLFESVLLISDFA